jgi:hypothetical protein
MSTLSIWSAPLLAAGSIALSGCNGSSSTPTTFTYHQIGICKSYEIDTGKKDSMSNEGFAVFKIDSIDNTNNGYGFYFDPVRFYVNQSKPEDKGNIYRQDRRFMLPDQRIGKALGVKYVDKVDVAKGEKVDDVGFVLIPLGTNNPSNGPDTDKYNFNMTYDTGTGDRGTFDSVAEGIKIVKTNPTDGQTIVDSCKDLALK